MTSLAQLPVISCCAWIVGARARAHRVRSCSFCQSLFAADGSGLGTGSGVDRHNVKGNHSVRAWSLCSRVFALQETDNLLCAMLAAMGDHCSPKSGMQGTKPFGDVQRKRSHVHLGLLDVTNQLQCCCGPIHEKTKEERLMSATTMTNDFSLRDELMSSSVLFSREKRRSC